MPHKQNPAHAERIVAIARLLRGHAVAALDAMGPAHERDMSVGRAEWVLVPEAACLAAASVHWSLVVARGLRVYPERMRDNVGRLGGLMLSEAVMLRLGRDIGRNEAHDVVYDAAMAAVEGGRAFRDVLLEDPRVTKVIGAAELDELLEPGRYTGLAGVFVDRVVAAWRAHAGA
jgi:adenylosuccinate lyase